MILHLSTADTYGTRFTAHDAMEKEIRLKARKI